PRRAGPAPGELVPGGCPRLGPGADRVPPRLLQRAPADHGGVRRLGRPGLPVHRRQPDRHGDGCPAVLPQGHRPDSQHLGPVAARMGWLIIIGTIPISLLGVTLKNTIEGPFRDLRLIAISLIVLGLILGTADGYAARAGRRGRHAFARRRKTIEDLNSRDGLIYGLCQSLALVPGVSRSGATVSGGLFLGYGREAAARYSFLLAIPAVLASGLFELKDVPDSEVAWGPTVLATLIAFG